MSRRTAATIPRGRPHLPVDDPDAPGTCATCHRPTGVPNDRHVDQLPDNPGAAAHDRAVLGEREDTDA